MQDNSLDTTNTMSVSDGWLRLSVHGASQGNPAQRGGAPLLIRKVPAGGSLETRVDYAALAATHANSKAGIVVFNAGTNVPLFWCAVAARAGMPAQVEVEAGGATVGANRTSTDDGVLGSPVYLRLVRNAAAQTWSCQVRSTTARAWTAVTSKVDFTDGAVGGSILEG
jgi:hypothetical protein